MEQTSLRFLTEVRHSLHSILGFLELALDEPLSMQQLGYLKQSRTSADRLLQIASDLWELNQPESVPQSCSSFQVATAVSEVADLARVFAARKGLAVKCTLLAGSQVRIAGVRIVIQDTLRRVLENAVQFTERGRVRLSADVRMNGKGAVLLFEVAFTAGGTHNDVLASLRSVDDTLPDRGLSMAVVRRRIARMNGQFSVVSGPTTGTIVRLTIPARLALREAPEQGTGPEHCGTFPQRLLVVEDSDDSFFVFHAYLSDQGRKLTRAYDGAQAVEMAQTGEYDLIVMDANMPVMDGYAATRAIRQWESNVGRFERMPILLFSADDPLKQARLGGAAGCSGHLTKPATKAEVLRALKFSAQSQGVAS